MVGGQTCMYLFGNNDRKPDSKTCAGILDSFCHLVCFRLLKNINQKRNKTLQ